MRASPFEHVKMAGELEYEDIVSIMAGVWDANRKLDRVIWLLEGEDEEEEETDPDA